MKLNRVPRLRPHAVERLPGAQSILSAAAKEAFIRRVLFDVGGFALFRRVVVMSQAASRTHLSTLLDRSQGLSSCDYQAESVACGWNP